MKKCLLKSMLVAVMMAIGMSVQAKEEVTDQYLTNADLYSLDGWDQHGYTAWKTDGAVPVIEFWNWSNSFSFTQTITLPKGNYRLAVNSFYRESWGGNGTNNNMAWIFAGEKKQNVIALNSMADLSGYAGGNDLYRAATAFSQGKFSNEFDFSISADNTDITLGFEGTTPNGGWCILGPVKLYQYTLEDYLVDYRAKVAEAEPYLTEKMSAATLAALNAAIVEESTLTSADEIALAIQNLNEAITAAKASIAAYEKLKAAIDKGEVFITTSIEYGAPESCKTALDGMKAAYDNGTIADADIDAAIAEIQAILIIVAKQQTKSGADMTPLLTNPDFELNPSVAEGWTIDVPDYGGYGNAIVGGNDFNHCFEAFSNPGFDVYQTVENTPYGVYEIQVQGFYRYLRDNAAWNAYQAQEVDYVKKQGVPVYIYMNDNATPFTNVFDVDPIPNGELYTTDPALLNPGNTPPYVEPSGQYWYPNDMYNAAVAFSQGMYRQSAFGLVAFDGDILRLGVKGVSNQGGDSWVIWDDFKLIYKGFDPEVIKPVLEEAVKDVEDTYIGLLMGKTEYAAFTDALALAEKAIAENDGENMFKALRDLYAAKDPALASKDIFLTQEVAADTTRLAEAIRDVANKKLANATRARANTLLNGLKNNLIYENDQIGQLKQDVTNMIDALNNSVILYSELDGLCNDFSVVITYAKEQGASAALIASAEELLADTRLGWKDASIEDEDIPTIEDNIRNMIDALNTSVTLYKQLAEAINTLEETINEAQNEPLVQNLLSNAVSLLNTAKEQCANASLDNVGTKAKVDEVNAMTEQLKNAIDVLYFYVEPLKYHVLSLEEKTVEVIGCDPNFSGDLVIPETVTYNGTTYTVTKIAARAFLSCTMIITIHVGENVQYIEDGAFEGCSSLTHIYIPSTLVNMGTGCFAGCSNLGGIDYYATASEIISKTIEYDEGVETIVVIIEFWNDITAITLPSTVKSIEEKAFWGCFRLMTVTSNIEDLFVINDNTFSDLTYQFGTLIVPDGMESVYRNTPGWKNFQNIIEASTVSVQSVTDIEHAESKVYNLGGQKVSGNLKKGLYISNGKKVVVR